MNRLVLSNIIIFRRDNKSALFISTCVFTLFNVLLYCLGRRNHKYLIHVCYKLYLHNVSPLLVLTFSSAGHNDMEMHRCRPIVIVYDGIRTRIEIV